MTKICMILLMFGQFILRGQPIDPQLENLRLPDMQKVSLKPYAKMDSPYIKEASGLVKSQLWENIYWTLNDSGDEPRIFPIDGKGKMIKPEWMENYVGIQIPDAVNVDWESITTDDRGHLIIADCGNNSSTRRDLAVYIINEPYPAETVTTCVMRRIMFRYPDQESIPSKNRNFDAESIFWCEGKLYILTKHRSDSLTKLYRFDKTDPLSVNELTYLETFNIYGRATGADISPDGRELIILTNDSVWLFQRTTQYDKFFSGKVSWLPVDAQDCEAICFMDEDKLMICNEQGDLFLLPVQELITLRK